LQPAERQRAHPKGIANGEHLIRRQQGQAVCALQQRHHLLQFLDVGGAGAAATIRAMNLLSLVWSAARHGRAGVAQGERVGEVAVVSQREGASVPSSTNGCAFSRRLEPVVE